MAILTFPRTFPSALPVVGMTFKPSPMIEVSPLRSGRQISKDLGPTLWRAKWQSGAMTQDKAGEVRAWYDTVLSLNEFYGFHLFRQYPLAYAASGWTGLTVSASPFSGSGVLTTVNADSVQISLESLPIGFQLSPGDYFAFTYSTSLRALHRCVAAATAGSDGKLTVEVRPQVRTGWAALAAVDFYRASARMIVLPDTYDEQDEPGGFTTVSFEAIQSL